MSYDRSKIGPKSPKGSDMVQVNKKGKFRGGGVKTAPPKHSRWSQMFPMEAHTAPKAKKVAKLKLLKIHSVFHYI